MQEFIMAVLDWLSSLGYIGIAIGLMLEVIPSEIVLGYGGYMISEGSIGFTGAVVAGTIGGTIAQLFLYWLGYFGGRPVLEKYGKYLFINKHHLEVSEKWFNQYGSGVIFSARFIPVVRHAISIPAGIAGMSAIKFTFYTIAAMIPWTVFFLYLGIVLGENWSEIKDIAKPFIIPISIIALGGGAVYILAARKQKNL
ncbi:DedA family protein [Mesobacillus selenatarsenatis]|uniref:DedA family protein n=1 Tax=Mesobacillus selenatarsenatis TaxID=388741 RepID=A0A846TGF8_9BACI|nr:DedA family protein [Mesobacillus selenatarsenatis]NKE07593.1 DedA family protein [Mesobacillus selenatarsenatis]